MKWTVALATGGEPYSGKRDNLNVLRGTSTRDSVRKLKMHFDPNVCFACREEINFVQGRKGSKVLPFDPRPSVPLAVSDDKGNKCWIHLDCYDRAQFLLNLTKSVGK